MNVKIILKHYVKQKLNLLEKTTDEDLRETSVQ